MDGDVLRRASYGVYISQLIRFARDTEAHILDLHRLVANGFVSSKIYDKRDDFDFVIVNFSFFDGDITRRASMV